MIKLQIEQGSENWHLARCGRVTGTRFKSLMAGESTATYKDLITDIAGEIITGLPVEDRYISKEMQDGSDREDDARKLYESDLSVEVEQVGFIIPDEDHEFHSWIGFSPDGLTKGLLEIKCPLRKTHMNRIEKDVLPAEYRHQIQSGMMIADLDYCDFVSYHPKMKLFIKRVNADYDLWITYAERLRLFIERVKQKIEVYNSYGHEGLEV